MSCQAGEEPEVVVRPGERLAGDPRLGHVPQDHQPSDRIIPPTADRQAPRLVGAGRPTDLPREGRPGTVTHSAEPVGRAEGREELPEVEPGGGQSVHADEGARSRVHGKNTAVEVEDQDPVRRGVEDAVATDRDDLEDMVPEGPGHHEDPDHREDEGRGVDVHDRTDLEHVRDPGECCHDCAAGDQEVSRAFRTTGCECTPDGDEDRERESDVDPQDQ